MYTGEREKEADPLPPDHSKIERLRFRVLQAAFLKLIYAVLLSVFGELTSVDLQLLGELFDSQLEVFHAFLNQDCLVT